MTHNEWMKKVSKQRDIKKYPFVCKITKVGSVEKWDVVTEENIPCDCITIMKNKHETE